MAILNFEDTIKNYANTNDYIQESLIDFLKDWDYSYQNSVNQIALFNNEITEYWTLKQKQFFTSVFYHLRGHFHDFLWYMGNFAPTFDIKRVVLSNISEEFGEDKQSHEKLYINFAESLGVDIIQESINQTHYLSFAREFNKGHLNWLYNHDYEHCIAAFAAYERLDNIDYGFLYNLVKSFNLPSDSVTFFKVHTYVKHFDAVFSQVQTIWENTPEKIVEGFNFIAKHQINMWNSLSQKILEQENIEQAVEAIL